MFLGNSNCAGVSELGSSLASPSPAHPVSGAGVSPRFLGAAVSPRPNDGPAIMSWCGGIKGGTGVALMVTLGFGRAGVEMLRSAQHDRLVLCTMLMNAAV